jgi:hypothetical protein
MNFVAGIIVGIVIATVGFSGVARLIDNGVTQTQSIVRSVAQ